MNYITAERVEGLSEWLRGWTFISGDDRQYAIEGAAVLRKLAELLRTGPTRGWEALLVYGQHYQSCYGVKGADGCCECGLSDLLTEARRIAPNGRATTRSDAGDLLRENERLRGVIEDMRKSVYTLRKKVNDELFAVEQYAIRETER